MLHLQEFGKYQIIRKLSRSMTDVYLARDTEANRTVVLKIIEHSRDEFTQLIIEAEKRGALLQKQLYSIDRRILQIYEFGEQNNCFFVGMEYFEGRTLAQILQAERRIPVQRAVRYAAEICSQLRTLHSFLSDLNGHKTAVVHGDIKPSNVQIGANDELRLLDFGIAKVITSTHNLTHHNLGSPSYCSPERISKSQVDPHADLWAVGVSLYEMIAGLPPYQAQDTRRLENLILSKRPPRALPQDCPAPVRCIIAKALAGDMARRYASAEAFEGDLRAYLEARPTTAEAEGEPVWDGNATIEKQHPIAAAPTRHAGWSETKKAVAKVIGPRSDASNVAIALLAGILAGLLIFIPIGYFYRTWMEARPLRARHDYAHADIGTIKADWNLYQELRKRHTVLSEFSPIAALDGLMHDDFAAAGENILETFRSSSDTRLSDFDWSKARMCLRYALDIEPSDTRAKAELALCTGYLNLAQNPQPPKAALSVESFRQAESFLPKSPDPHLALARVYIYAFHNVGQAMAEFHQAEQHGYKLGPPEQEEEADGYLFRAEWALARAKRMSATARQDRTKWLQLAHDDIERARSLYEPIVGFSNVSTNLEQLQEDGFEQAQLENANLQAVITRPHYQKHPSGVRRWR